MVTGREVSARQAAEGELRTVGAAAHGDRPHGDAAGGIRPTRGLDEVRVLGAGDDLGHVAVLVADLDGEHGLAGRRGRAQRVLLVHLGHGRAEQVLSRLKAVAVVVADDVVRAGILAVALNALQVEEALAVLRELRAVLGRNELVHAEQRLGGVDHHVLRGTGVDRAPVGADGRPGSVERLVAKLAQGACVDGVAVGSTQRFEVEQRCAMADLLVRDKRQRERRMRDGGVLGKACEKRDGHGHGRLVVSAEKRRAVRGHKVLANEVFELRVCGGVEGDFGAVAAAAQDKPSAIVALDLRVDRAAICLPRGVEVAAERERGARLGTGACGPMGRDVGVLVERDVLGAKVAQVSGNNARHIELGRGRGHRLRGARIRLRGNLAIPHEPLEHVTCRLASHAVVPLP